MTEWYLSKILGQKKKKKNILGISLFLMSRIRFLPEAWLICKKNTKHIYVLIFFYMSCRNGSRSLMRDHPQHKGCLRMRHLGTSDIVNLYNMLTYSFYLGIKGCASNFLGGCYSICVGSRGSYYTWFCSWWEKFLIKNRL